MSRINAIRGMNDILPDSTARWQQVESVLRGLMQRHGYQEIRLPVVEPTPLFKRAIGEVTDIDLVGTQMEIAAGRSLVVELPRDVHPYYVGAQFHPEFRSRPTRAHPLFAGLVAAALSEPLGVAESSPEGAAPADASDRRRTERRRTAREPVEATA